MESPRSSTQEPMSGSGFPSQARKDSLSNRRVIGLRARGRGGKNWKAMLYKELHPPLLALL